MTEQPDIHVVPDSGEATEVDTRDKIEFLGREFHLADVVGLMPLLRFAHAAQSGLDSADVEGMAAMYDLLEQTVIDEEWAAFQAHATKKRASDDDLMKFIQDTMTILGERPTRRSSESSDGPPATSGKSEDGSSARVITRLEQRGRPDLALIVTKTMEARAAS